MPSDSASGSSTASLATPHSLATDAGMRAYRDGGNAIDAAIAAAAVLAVVYPHNVSLGGDLIALVRTPNDVVRCVNASGWAAGGVDVVALRATHGSQLPAIGVDTVTVPGGVRGWEALRRFGARLTWERCLEPAEQLARSGAPVASSLAAHFADAQNAALFASADFAEVFHLEGRNLRAGDPLIQPALAETYAALRQRGPDDFYGGSLAARTVAYLRSQGSAMTTADFETFQPEVVDPLSIDFDGLTVHTSPPNTQGFVLLHALRAVAGSGIRDPLGDGLAAFLRICLHGNTLRDKYLADPRYGGVDASALVAGGFDQSTEFGGLPPGPSPIPRGDTVGVAAADGDGYAVSLIQSVFGAFGSGLVDPVTGVLFHNRGTGFSLDPASPNVIAPRKRPAHTLTPVMTTRDGVLSHVLSTMGGQGQPQILGQVLLRAMAGATAEEAVNAARAIVGAQVDGATAETVTIEQDLSERAKSALADVRVEPLVVPSHTDHMGHANVVFVNGDGTMAAASDPRSDGSAATDGSWTNRNRIPVRIAEE